MKLQFTLPCELALSRGNPPVNATISESAGRIDAANRSYLARPEAELHDISLSSLASGENSTIEALDTTYPTAGEAKGPDNGNCRDRIFPISKEHRKQSITTPRSAGGIEQVSLLR